MSQTHEMITGNTLPYLRATLRDAYGNPLVITGDVTFYMWSTAGVVKINGSAAVVTDGARGKVEYRWASGDVDTEGTYLCRFHVVDGPKNYDVPNEDDEYIKVILGSATP
jgi:hypothetical protein